jgi:hypothetical protein
MKISLGLLIPTMSIVLAASAFAANPFLNAKDDKPVSVSVRGTEWNDEEVSGETPLTARMITTRVASMPWGAIFKIEFVDPKSRIKKHDVTRADYFIATDDRILRLNTSKYVQMESGVRTEEQDEADNAAAAKKISAMEKAPDFEQGDIRAINSGKLTFEEGPYTTEITVKGDECTYLTSHNSGHFTKFVWKKGVGLVEHAAGYGAGREGHRLKRAAAKK